MASGGGDAMMPDVLLVEDNDDLREEVAAFLRFRQFAVRDFRQLSEARASIAAKTPQVAIIDVFLPDGSGLSLLDTLREHAPSCLKMILSARSDINLKLEAYRHGADNYLLKPIDMRELVALLDASFRRVPAQDLAAWVLNADSLTISGPDGGERTITLQEASLLKALARGKDKFASRKDLIGAIGYDPGSYDEQRLEALVSRLRKKLVPLGGNPIKAAHGRGYVFTERLMLR
jgi:DNA-binding response OmpR family regulator